MTHYVLDSLNCSCTNISVYTTYGGYFQLYMGTNLGYLYFFFYYSYTTFQWELFFFLTPLHLSDLFSYFTNEELINNVIYFFKTTKQFIQM